MLYKIFKLHLIIWTIIMLTGYIGVVIQCRIEDETDDTYKTAINLLIVYLIPLLCFLIRI